MTCKGILKSLTDYIEGDLDGTVCTLIEDHLRGCKRCRMHVDSMKRMVILYKQWRAEPIPEDVSKRLQGTLSEIFRLTAAKGEKKKASKGARTKGGDRLRKAKSIKVKTRASARQMKPGGRPPKQPGPVTAKRRTGPRPKEK